MEMIEIDVVLQGFRIIRSGLGPLVQVVNWFVMIHPIPRQHTYYSNESCDEANRVRSPGEAEEEDLVSFGVVVCKKGVRFLRVLLQAQAAST